MFAAPLETFVAPARARRQIWRLLLGLLVIGLVYLAGTLLILILVVTLTDFSDSIFDHVNPRRWSEPAFALTILATFLAMALGPMLAVRWLHRRSVATLFGRGARVMRDFAICAGVMLSIWLPITVIVSAVEPPATHLTLTLWLTLLPLTLGAIALQTLAEELVFRGYLLQQLAARFSSPLAWMVLPSLVFGAMHYDPQMPSDTRLAAIGVTVIFALVATDLTARTGSIGAAWGLHFANNFMSLAVVSLGDTITGLSLFTTRNSVYDQSISPALFLVDAAALLAAWAVLRWILSRQ